MRRTAVFVGVALASLTASVGLSSAGTPPQISVTPNPAVAGEDITITNEQNDASTCETDAPGDGDVDLFIRNIDTLEVVYEDSAVPDDNGNWQAVTQIAEPGVYDVFAICNGEGGGGGALTSTPERFGPFDYAPASLTVVEADVPIDPGPPLVLVPAPLQDLQPAFTG